MSLMFVSKGPSDNEWSLATKQHTINPNDVNQYVCHHMLTKMS